MAILNVLHFPDPRLRIKATPVDNVDKEIKQLIKDMYETMYNAPGIGLAATQVDIHKQLIVIDISENKEQPFCFINPRILHQEGEEMMEEGCLSVPGVYEKVKRAHKIQVEALDQKGDAFKLDAEGVLAVCIQHEIDHLFGNLFVDYLSEMKRDRIRKKMEKLQRNTS